LGAKKGITLTLAYNFDGLILPQRSPTHIGVAGTTEIGLSRRDREEPTLIKEARGRKRRTELGEYESEGRLLQEERKNK
jgi:hypothetical protein